MKAKELHLDKPDAAAGSAGDEEVRTAAFLPARRKASASGSRPHETGRPSFKPPSPFPTSRAQVLYKIEVPANRYDLLCLEGLSRALRIFAGMEVTRNEPEGSLPFFFFLSLGLQRI